MPTITIRHYSEEIASLLAQTGMHPVLSRIYAARGVTCATQLESEFVALLPLQHLKNIERMAGLLADAISAKKRLLIIADYDSDGATACAVGMRALREFGALVEYIVPNRFEYGYGLTPEIVRLAAEGSLPAPRPPAGRASGGVPFTGDSSGDPPAYSLCGCKGDRGI